MRAKESHFEKGRKSADVCSLPPSDVGDRIVESTLAARELFVVDDGGRLLGSGRK